MTPISPPKPVRLRRSWVQRGVLLLNVLLIALALGLAALLNYGYGQAASINRVALGRSLTAVPEDQEPGERVINILLVGSDSSAGLDEDDPIQIGRQGERFGDVIIIAHIDERSGEIALLSLPRDLWVDIAGTDRSSRINQAFVTGGPATLIETIEEEFGIPIHHYVNVDFAGFQGLVAAVGSVDVYFETPARDWNVNAVPTPRSQTGFIVEEAGCQSLDPEMALAYVRSRYYQTQNEDGDWVTDPTSDLGRIRRQQDFLRRTIQRAISVGARNPFVLQELIETGLENVAIDQRLTPQLLVDLGVAYRSFDPDGLQTYSFPAADGQVGRNLVLLPRPDEAEPVLALFQGAAFDDPTTVGLTVVTGEESMADHELDRLRSLREAGFELEVEEGANLPEGLILRHGPDGRHAAELVAANLAEPVNLQQVDRLAGRSLELVFGTSPQFVAGGPSAPAAIDPAADESQPAEPSAESQPDEPSDESQPDEPSDESQPAEPSDEPVPEDPDGDSTLESQSDSAPIEESDFDGQGDENPLEEELQSNGAQCG